MVPVANRLSVAFLPEPDVEKNNRFFVISSSREASYNERIVERLEIVFVENAMDASEIGRANVFARLSRPVTHQCPKRDT